MKKKKLDIFSDPEGIKYKHPERSCKKCSKYPCFEGIESMVCDFAKYGCRDWKSD